MKRWVADPTSRELFELPAKYFAETDELNFTEVHICLESRQTSMSRNQFNDERHGKTEIMFSEQRSNFVLYPVKMTGCITTYFRFLLLYLSVDLLY